MVWTPSLVIFDCDGVLVDSEPIANRLIAEALSKVGQPMSGEQALEYFREAALSDTGSLADGRRRQRVRARDLAGNAHHPLGPDP